MSNPLEKISQANDNVSGYISLAASKKEYIGKQVINTILLFIILLVFGCLDFAKLAFHFENLLSASYWGTVISKTIAGICSFNIGINLMWEIEIKKDIILKRAIDLYEHLIMAKKDDFEYFVIHVYNPNEKAKAYISQINRKIYWLNKFSRPKDRLLYSSDLPERQEQKKKNWYCIKRQELEDLKDEEFIRKNLDSLKVKYYYVDPTVFELEIDGSAPIRGTKTKGNVNAGKAKASSNVALSMLGFSAFLTAIGLELNQEEFTNQMVRFWHYVMKCATDVGIVLWQTYRGMFTTRKIVSNELTQPYVGRNTVLKAYYKWQFENGKIDEGKYNDLVNFKEEEEITLTPEQLKKLKEEKHPL